MSEFVLEMNNIIKTFPGVKALNDVTLKVKSGTVHALVGENGAGKSTLMKCLFGIYQEDSGDIILDGKKVNMVNSKAALDYGVSMIHQELHPIPYRSIMENIWLGRFPKKSIAVDSKAMYRKTKELFSQIDLNLDPKTIAANLSVSNLQLVDISKSVSYNSKIIIMDEPTSSLTENEVSHLFKIINKLKSEGRSIIYISHKIEEILEISDEVSIMRDGKLIGTWSSSELTNELIINRMVGRELSNRFPVKNYIPRDEVILGIKGFTSSNPMSFKDANFSLRKGEILGIGGLVGAQRTELVESIFGLRSVSSGEIIMNGKPIKVKSAIDAINNRIALLTEERRATGVFGVLSVLENTIVASQKKYSNSLSVIKTRQRKKASQEATKKLNVKTYSLDALIQNLSGGNQQKVLIARWLLTVPDILILDEPTRGIDVGAKYEIYTIMHSLVNEGKSIIMISSEMPELLGMSDRIMVMCEGRVTGILDKTQASQVEVMRLATMFE